MVVGKVKESGLTVAVGGSPGVVPGATYPVVVAYSFVVFAAACLRISVRADLAAAPLGTACCFGGSSAVVAARVAVGLAWRGIWLVGIVWEICDSVGVAPSGHLDRRAVFLLGCD